MKIVVAGDICGPAAGSAGCVSSLAALPPPSAYRVPAVTARMATRCGARIAARCRAASGVIAGKAVSGLAFARSHASAVVDF